MTEPADGCPQCGQFACMCFDDDDRDDGLDENGNIPFDCPAFYDGQGWHCPLAGTEECDWECPHS